VRPRDEFDLLLEAPNPTSARIARNLLDDAGIPSFLHGRDIGDEGEEVFQEITRPDLFVPKGMKEKAQEVLRTAGFE
jgi:hypothetical protein